MRIIIKDCADMSIIIEGVEKIINDNTGVTFIGFNVRLMVNGYVIANSSNMRLEKSFLLMADEVYFDTRIEEAD